MITEAPLVCSEVAAPAEAVHRYPGTRTADEPGGLADYRVRRICETDGNIDASQVRQRRLGDIESVSPGLPSHVYLSIGFVDVRKPVLNSKFRNAIDCNPAGKSRVPQVTDSEYGLTDLAKHCGQPDREYGDRHQHFDESEPVAAH
jgi:hypothetical protein